MHNIQLQQQKSALSIHAVIYEHISSFCRKPFTVFTEATILGWLSTLVAVPSPDRGSVSSGSSQDTGRSFASF